MMAEICYFDLPAMPRGFYVTANLDQLALAGPYPTETAAEAARVAGTGGPTWRPAKVTAPPARTARAPRRTTRG
jgi:hypothetical protein